MILLLNGPLEVTSRIRQLLHHQPVIAVDGGIRHAKALGVIPDLWVGDLDSSPENALDEYVLVPRKQFPKDKDQTDGELAVAEALAQGAKSLLLLGALGGQTDHTLTHMLLALRLAQQGYQVHLSNGLEDAFPLLSGQQNFNLEPETRFSIVPFSVLSGLTLEGAAWPLTNATVQPGTGWTLSNLSLGKITVGLEAGEGFILLYF